MKSGRTLWEEMQIHYNRGVEYVTGMQKEWDSLGGGVDKERFDHVKARLELQIENAKEWRDVCIKYFGKFVETSEKNKN